MVLVDSSVWIDYFNGVASPETDTLDALLGQDLVLIGDLILTVGAWRPATSWGSIAEPSRGR